MDPFTISLIISLLAGAAITIVAYLTINTVRNYIRERRTRHSAKEKAVVMINNLKNGNYVVAAGFLEPDGEITITDAQQWEAESIDQDLQKLPIGKPIIINS